LRRKKAAAVVLRPDGFIYAAAESGHPLPPPPVGCTFSASTSAATRTEATA
jgi:3-(3-hydroxy-phenyl)propionate hydroxylase